MTQQLIFDLDRGRINIGGFAVSRGAGASGYASDGPVLKITPSGPSFTVKRGQDGTEVRSKTNNKGADLELAVLSSNSPTNGFLSGLITADEAGPNGASIVSFVYEDMQGTSRFVSDAAYVVSRPEQPIQSEAQDLIWKFHAIWRIWIIGGN